MKEELISVIEIAKLHGKRPQAIHKIVRRLNIETTKIKSEEARGQTASYISKDDYETIKDYLVKPESNGNDDIDLSSSGVFYLIQLEPEHDPGRFKVGFASSIDERLRKHKTAAPYSKVIKTWPCKLLWEKTVIDSVSQGCERVHTEVFRVEDLDLVKERCDKFFLLMPDLGNK